MKHARDLQTFIKMRSGMEILGHLHFIALWLQCIVRCLI